VTTRDIKEHLAEVYGAEVSRGLISNVTDVVQDEITQRASENFDGGGWRGDTGDVGELPVGLVVLYANRSRQELVCQCRLPASVCHAQPMVSQSPHLHRVRFTRPRR
jgi:hypothetical protein